MRVLQSEGVGEMDVVAIPETRRAALAWLPAYAVGEAPEKIETTGPETGQAAWLPAYAVGKAPEKIETTGP